MSGTVQPRASRRSRIAGTAAAASAVFTVTRTSSEPASASARTWSTVAAMSAVSVLVIDCTTIGAAPPIATSPTRTVRVRWRMIPDSLLIGSLQAQPSHVTLRVAHEVDRIAAIDERHCARVADDDIERRRAANRLLGTRG